eukprot:GILK01017627.1.p1 GENE.GILK01017627.1~~GILK01017627.1.p1  ORF type:complete len:188 (-),score=16.97 GILK01017627.1:135-698(-)
MAFGQWACFHSEGINWAKDNIKLLSQGQALKDPKRPDATFFEIKAQLRGTELLDVLLSKVTRDEEEITEKKRVEAGTPHVRTASSLGFSIGQCPLRSHLAPVIAESLHVELPLATWELTSQAAGPTLKFGFQSRMQTESGELSDPLNRSASTSGTGVRRGQLLAENTYVIGEGAYGERSTGKVTRSS